MLRPPPTTAHTSAPADDPASGVFSCIIPPLSCLNIHSNDMISFFRTPPERHVQISTYPPYYSLNALSLTITRIPYEYSKDQETFLLNPKQTMQEDKEHYTKITIISLSLATQHLLSQLIKIELTRLWKGRSILTYSDVTLFN